jgi:heat shock protein HtpX
VRSDVTTRHDPTGDLVRIGAVHALVVFVPVAVAAALVLPLWLAPLVAAVVAVAVTVVRARGADQRVAAAVGARRLDAAEQPRLHGAVEHVAMAVGAAPPVLHLVDDPARNAVVWGSGQRPASLAVTTGLLDSAELIELEAVVAHLLTDVRDGLVEAPTAATALFGPLAGGPLGGLVASLARAGADDDRRIVLADLEGARATAYPPGVAAALERVAAGSSTVARCPRSLQALWFAAPCEPDTDDPFSAHPPVADRIDLLREL